MDLSDKKILEHQLAAPIGKAVYKWMRENEIDSPVCVHAAITNPSCYVDEQGVSHTGPLVTINCEIIDDSDFDDDDDLDF